MQSPLQPEDPAVRQLKSCINDLMSALSLPAIWSGMGTPELVSSALDLLVGMLRLDFAFILLHGRDDQEALQDLRLARGSDTGASSGQIAAQLKHWLDDDRPASGPAAFRRPDDAPCFLTPFRLGVHDEIGWVVAGSSRPDFPGPTDRLLVGVVGNQVVIGLQEAQLMIKQKRIAGVLEATVIQRTAQLQSLNEALTVEIAERDLAQQRLRRSEFFLTQGQRLSHTGSFGLETKTGKLYWSEESYRIWDFPTTVEPSFDRMRERVHPGDAAFFEEMVRQRARDGADVEFELRLVPPNGQLKYVRVTRRALFGKSGEVEQLVGAIQDITPEKLASKRIQELQDRLQRENVVLREQIDQTSMFEEIVGTSAALQPVLSRISKVAPTDTTVLITGDTGTGKELIARAIHKRSRRAAGSFVPVNCAAIPSALISSELFGHEKGAFTGALQRRLGRFEIAEGGTLFLDEVGELPAETQIALLRVLQEREFERIGGSQVRRADVRVIAATNRDLTTAVADGTFRRDLYYRLSVFPLEMPSLRERREDIPMLTEYFIQRYASKLGKRIAGIDQHCLDLFQSYAWPGNIRELQNVIERSLIVCESDVFSVDESWLAHAPAAPAQATAPRHSATLSLHSAYATPQASATVAAERQATPGARERAAAAEKSLIEATLAATRGRVSGPAGAAARLGLPASTLESKIRSLKINKHQFRLG